MAFKERYTQLFGKKAVQDAIFAGQNVLCCVFAISAESAIDVGIYDTNDLEVWQLMDLLNSRDALFFRYDSEGDSVPF